MMEIEKTLSQYPSSFSVKETIDSMSREEIGKKKHKLEIELESSEKVFSTDMEKVRVENLLSFLHYHLGEREKATHYNEIVLKREPENMIALSNKVWFSLRDRKNILKCKELCDRLKVINRQNEVALIIARAEVAFTYSKLGIRNYKKASSEFGNVLRDCKKMNELENGSDFAAYSTPVKVPADYICVWMYRKALCHRRLSHLYYNDELADMEEIRKYYHDTLELCMEIIRLESSESDCIKRYKARSYVEIGFISYDVARNPFAFPYGMEEFMHSNPRLLMHTTDYFTKALQYYQDDVSVLERSGKYFRYINELDKSVRLLIRAIQIRPTSFCYHHIALSYKRLLEFNEGELARKLLELPMDSGNKLIEYTFSFGECNDDDLAVGNPTNRRQESSHGNRIHPYSVVGLDIDQDQIFKKLITSVETAIQALHKRRRDMQQSSYAAIDKLSGNFSRFGINPKRGNSSRLKTKSGIKCPKVPITIDHNEHNKPIVDTVIRYLDTAHEMSSNPIAIYDKALLYRQISQPKTALKVLDDLLQNNDIFITHIMRANIYEQSAFCIIDMLHRNNDFNETEKLEMEADRDFNLISSVEISCVLTDRIPSLDRCWKSAPTLRNILFDKLETKRTKDTLKELWYLYKKLNEHPGAIKILRELQTLADDVEEEKEFLEGIVQHQISKKNFEEAVIALCMSKQVGDGQPLIEKNLYIKTYIEAGLDAFRRKHFQQGKMRIEEAFKSVRESQQTHGNSEASNGTNRGKEENELFDIFILSNLDDDENGQKLMMLLNSLGLKTTFNTESPAISPGTPEVLGMENIMRRSNAFVIIKDFDTDNTKMQNIIDRMQSIVEYRHNRSLILVVTLPESTEILPGSFYATQKTITIDLKPVPKDTFFTPEGFKSLLMALALV